MGSIFDSHDALDFAPQFKTALRMVVPTMMHQYQNTNHVDPFRVSAIPENRIDEKPRIAKTYRNCELYAFINRHHEQWTGMKTRDYLDNVEQIQYKVFVFCYMTRMSTIQQFEKFEMSDISDKVLQKNEDKRNIQAFLEMFSPEELYKLYEMASKLDANRFKIGSRVKLRESCHDFELQKDEYRNPLIGKIVDFNFEDDLYEVKFPGEGPPQYNDQSWSLHYEEDLQTAV